MYQQYKKSCASPAQPHDDRIPHVDTEVDPKSYEEGLKVVMRKARPKWSNQVVKFKLLQQGYGNLMVTCMVDEDNKKDWAIARIFGASRLEIFTALDIDRNFEVKAAKLFFEIGVGPPVLATFTNGIVYQFIEGKTCSWEDLSPMRDPKRIRAAARVMAKVHSQSTLKLAMEKYEFGKMTKDVHALMKTMCEDANWERDGTVILDEETTKWYLSNLDPFEARMAETEMIVKTFKSTTIPTTMCHVDANPTNMIYIEEEDRMVLVDFEASGPGSPCYDLSGFLEGLCGFVADPTEVITNKEREDFIQTYLSTRQVLDGESPEIDEAVFKKYFEAIDMITVLNSYFTPIVMVSMAQSGGGKKSLELALGRMDFYHRNKDRVLSYEL